MPRQPRDIQRDPTTMDSDPDAWRDSFHAERFPDRSADEVTVDTLAVRSLPQTSLEGDTDADEELAEPARRPGYLGESARIGRYAVLRTLGEGGMGVVYSAYDEELDRRVALKLLRPGRDNSSHNQARMQREARAMARLSHPNVVQVYEVGRWEQQVYVAMEFVQGRTLGAWLRAATHTWQQILDVLIQAGRGLQAAHQANVVHGDFKPDNILIDADDRPRVVDFGLSRTEPRESPAPLPETADPGATSPAEPVAAEGTSADSGAPEGGRSQGGRVAGTPAFMAAEQHAGRQADARTDQFAFAITLYTALYGHHPFAGGSLLELVINVTDGKIRPIPADTPVPPGVHAAIVRALSKEPEQRFASVGEFLDELERGSGRARDPEFDLSVARRQRVVLATVIAASIVAISIVIIIGSPEGGLMPTPASNAIAGGVINAVLLSLIFAFRRSFFKNTINRRVMGWLVVSSLTMLIHRTAAVILATPVETAMVNDLLLLGAVASMAAIAIDAWIGYAAAIMLLGALLCIALPTLSALILVSALVGVFVLAFRFWSR